MNDSWTTTHDDQVEIYRSDDGWRYRVKATNGETVEVGSEAYSRKADAVKAAKRHHPPVTRDNRPVHVPGQLENMSMQKRLKQLHKAHDYPRTRA